MQNIIHNDANFKDSDGDGDESEKSYLTSSISEALKAAKTLIVFVQTNFDDDVLKL